MLAASGAAQVVPQTEFTPERLASLLRKALADPASLTAAAQAAKAAGRRGRGGAAGGFGGGGGEAVERRPWIAVFRSDLRRHRERSEAIQRS